MNISEINWMRRSLVTAISDAIEYLGGTANRGPINHPAIVRQGCTLIFGEAASGDTIFDEAELRAMLRDYPPARIVQNRDTWWAAQRLAGQHLQTALARHNERRPRPELVEIE